MTAMLNVPQHMRLAAAVEALGTALEQFRQVRVDADEAGVPHFLLDMFGDSAFTMDQEVQFMRALLDRQLVTNDEGASAYKGCDLARMPAAPQEQ